MRGKLVLELFNIYRDTHTHTYYLYIYLKRAAYILLILKIE